MGIIITGTVLSNKRGLPVEIKRKQKYQKIQLKATDVVTWWL